PPWSTTRTGLRRSTPRIEIHWGMPPIWIFSRRSIPFGVSILRALAMIAVASARLFGFAAPCEDSCASTETATTAASKSTLHLIKSPSCWERGSCVGLRRAQARFYATDVLATIVSHRWSAAPRRCRSAVTVLGALQRRRLAEHSGRAAPRARFRRSHDALGSGAQVRAWRHRTHELRLGSQRRFADH